MKGNITRRGKNSWRIKFDIGPDANGKRKIEYRTVRGRRSEAEALMSKLLAGVGAGEHVELAKHTFGDYLRIWLNSQAASAAPKTLERQTEIVEKHLIPALGKHHLQKLTALQIDAYYAEARKAGRRDGRGGLSERTLLHHHRVIFGALRHAGKKRLVMRNVAQDADCPTPQRSDIEALDEAQTAKVILAAEGSVWYLPILMAATTGMRRGEVLGLRWCDVNLDVGKIHVARSLQEVGKVLVTKEPKTKESRRAIDLPALTLEALKRHRLAQAEQRLSLGLPKEEGAYVFADVSGGALKPSRMTKAFEYIVRKAKVPKVSLHALRHSHASHLLASGINVKVVSERLGHTSAKTTLDIYAKVLPGMQADAANLIDAAMRTALARNKSTP